MLLRRARFAGGMLALASLAAAAGGEKSFAASGQYRPCPPQSYPAHRLCS